jgi:hypothetical protein
MQDRGKAPGWKSASPKDGWMQSPVGGNPRALGFWNRGDGDRAHEDHAIALRI